MTTVSASLPDAAGRRRRPIALAFVLGPLVLRRWGASMGTTPARLLAFVGVAMAGTAVLAAKWSAGWHPTETARGDVAGTAEVLLLAVAVALFFGSAAFGIFAARSRRLPRTLSFLRTLPVSSAEAERAGAVPALALGAGAALALLPTAITVTTRLTGRGAAHAAVLIVLLLVAGAASGRLVLGFVEWALPGARASSLQLTVAYLLWSAALATSLTAPSALLQWADSIEALAGLAPLGWPLAWWALVDPSPAVLAGAAGVSAAFAWASHRLGPAAEAERAGAEVRPVAFTRPLPLVRFEARRVIRNPRSLEAVVVAGFCSLALVAAVAWVGSRTLASISPVALGLLGAQVVTGFAATARGLSSRHRPVEQLLGIRPARHLTALLGASLTLAVAASVPALVASFVLLEPITAVAWLAALPVCLAVALGVSVALTPELGNGGAEAGAILAYAAVSAAVLAVITGQRSVPAVAVAMALTAGVLAATVNVEGARRRTT